MSQILIKKRKKEILLNLLNQMKIIIIKLKIVKMIIKLQSNPNTQQTVFLDVNLQITCPKNLQFIQ